MSDDWDDVYGQDATPVEETLIGNILAQRKRIEELEAELAKAVKGLKRICMQPDYRLPSMQEIARATIAKIKGEQL